MLVVVLVDDVVVMVVVEVELVVVVVSQSLHVLAHCFETASQRLTADKS